MRCLLIVPKGFVYRHNFYECNTNLSKPKSGNVLCVTKLSIMDII